MARSLFSLLCLALVILMALATPAGAANKEHQQLMADVRMLQEQLQRQQLMIGQLTDALKAATGKLDQQAVANQRLLADQKQTIQGMADDLRVVREKADDNNVRLGTLAHDVETISQSMPQMSGGAVTPPGAANPPPSGGGELGALPSRIFDQAQADYFAGNYDLAITGFHAYLNNDPKSPKAPDAQMYIGHSYRAQGKFDRAVDAYTRVINNYPSSGMVAPALFRRGATYEDAGDKAKARESYQALIDKFPADNTSVVSAVMRMAQIK